MATFSALVVYLSGRILERTIQFLAAGNLVDFSGSLVFLLMLLENMSL
jgi:hypothetical protein